MAHILINAWRFFFHPFLTWHPTGAVKASRDNLTVLRRNSFVWLFLLSFHERVGKCPCLVKACACLAASFIVSLFIIPFPANESWTMTLHTAPTTWLYQTVRVYDLKKFQRLIHVKLKAVSCYNITWIYSYSFNIGFGWYNTRISHSFVEKLA